MSSRSRKRHSGGTQDLMEVDTDGSLSDEHQLLLQYLMHARMSKKMDVSRIHGKLFNDSENLKESLKIITSKINALKMDIKSVCCDVSGETYFVLIHSTGESFFPKSCMFSQSQLEFLKKLLIGIVLSESGMIGKIAALNSCTTLSKMEADNTLRQFVKDKIFLELPEGKLALSPLAIVEFEPFFRASLEDNLQSCELCRQLVFFGKVCPNCDQKFHRHCVYKWLESGHSDCSKCKEQWDDGMLTETE
ncbi:non-structural maintenance of chromosomes element 1 homolog [Macrosteles quadrilineatus]|uniref:non-structural maintenance of chromosomes element 1 homolog n=1 Tax=Macrosteles quadrilineatus TaxID=74068 RepID=UPI0023E2E509|nr:non-structural maintenance of chromosomes element 1 homolog [Macrosteles quadrilineatus]XP_054262259.1 non-structural maintenance of chromosomes element 1 homolog [Macrosteles quadrilineatus]XP_054262260.1 non-structural maintenance of chromosomes element 1 homolog [Macrosteles quadrilineatus]XP_054262261.1 non-structural maintenance of chromosomes element 1 homolog [Macrosteles quadrilineatus]XP_054262262.1 non-structural maintenance of chromosomes element 1 homolog [Macrosteles quadrilinea